jgi:hypothetical protein
MIPAAGEGHTQMNSIKCHISISLDGFVAGPNQGLENPIGEGGMRLHQWAFKTASWRQQQGLDGGELGADSGVVEEVVQDVGAYIMGRRMFGGGEGPWDQAWTGSVSRRPSSSASRTPSSVRASPSLAVWRRSSTYRGT